MNFNKQFTIAIPTFNSAQRLPLLLEKLKAQTAVDDLTWEVVVVDNNSSDNTAEMVRQYQENWLDAVPLRYILETQQGAAFARLKAVQEADGELIGFLDDDNLPDNNWIASAFAFCQKLPKAGAVGGQIHANFEVQPPEGFDRIKQFLAIREHGSIPYQFDAYNLRLPPAASLVVRKQAWMESVPAQPALSGKLPGILIQGDDYEPLLYMYKSGWEIWYNPDMVTYHQIPHWRLEKDYLLKIARGCGLATYTLRTINAQPQETPILFARTFLGNLRRILAHAIQYRTQLKMDLIARFQFEFFFASMLSPFLALNRRFKFK
jgi:glycosyltransferase involved in cell wall biosynthesis